VRPRVAIDLFAGAGGATEGLKRAGFTILAAVELDETSAQSYGDNHPEVALTPESITDVDAHALRAELGLDEGELDLLNACPPCQGFSSLGNGDADDPNNELINEVWRFVDAFKPQCLLLENVPGLASDARLKALVDGATDLGYEVRQYRVDAADFGVPQHRRRLIVLAVSADSGATLPADLLDELPADFDRTPRTVGDTLVDLGRSALVDDPLDRSRDHTKEVLARLRALPVNGTRFDLPPEHRLKCHDRLDKRNATSSYGRLRSDEPASTLTTRCATPACGRFVHPTEPRGLTLREAATLQTFQPEYAFRGTFGQIERQIGNAFPAHLAHGIAVIASGVLDAGTVEAAA